MTRILLISAAVVVGLAYLYDWMKKKKLQLPNVKPKEKVYKRYQAKIDPHEIWVQVYETDKREEASNIKARLEEQDIKVILFEQAKKSLKGESPPGVGVVVPKAHLKSAQSLIFRYLESH